MISIPACHAGDPGSIPGLGDFHIHDILEIGDWRLEIGDWRLEIGDWRLEIGGN